MTTGAREFARTLIAGHALASGETAIAHADGTSGILQSLGAPPEMVMAPYLAAAAERLADPRAVLEPLFEASQTSLARHAVAAAALERALGRTTSVAGRWSSASEQTERVRKLLLAFADDLRVVLLRLAARLQAMRHLAATRTPAPPGFADETLRVWAPLANRLGIGQIRWELEDLAFRFRDPEAYKRMAALLDEKRVARESRIEVFRAELARDLAANGFRVRVQGRPKHLYSIWRKMHAKGLPFERVMDVLAVRVVVDGDGAPAEAACYAVLGRVHERWRAIAGEFDDYVARPKGNGYRSLHTVVETDDGRAVEIQIRTDGMHRHAESGVAAHWAYKEAVAGRPPAATDLATARIAESRMAVLRQLLAWRQDVADEGDDGGPAGPSQPHRVGDERIYVFTPDVAVVELGPGSTPIDFAYAVHTELGHRCRGARVDGSIVPLSTPLATGQTVEIQAAKSGGPSLDWLNPELGFLQSARSKAKVRGWFNAVQQAETSARGRAVVEKLLQREGRTAIRLDDLAVQLGLADAQALYQAVGKDELPLRGIETVLRGRTADVDDAALPPLVRRSRAGGGPGGDVLVVGIGSLLTSLARCCRPAPPDAIGGYVTRGRGVAIHRASCANFREMAARSPERVVAVAWNAVEPRKGDSAPLYAVEVAVEAADRQGLLRDVSEVFAREKTNVVAVQSRSVGAQGGTAHMQFTLEVVDASRLDDVLAAVCRVAGVRAARRR